MKHITTDPACTQFKAPPRKRYIGEFTIPSLRRWRYNRASGKACTTCRPQRKVSA